MSYSRLADSIDDATERLVEILRRKFNDELDSAFGRDADNFTDDGIYLPDLDGDEIYRYPAPNRRDREDMAAKRQQTVAGFVGFVGDSSSTDTYTASSQGRLVDVARPFGAALLFNHAPQKDASAAGQSRNLTPNELMYKRSVLYLGALEHTVAKYACRHDAVNDSSPRSDLPITGGIEIDEGKLGLWGVVLYEFDVDQEVLFPMHANL